MKRAVLYVAMITVCTSYVSGLAAKKAGTDGNVKLVQVGRITSIDWINGSIKVRGVALGEDSTRSSRAESRILLTESTPILYHGAAITFLDLQVGDLIRASGPPQGADLLAREIQKYRSAIYESA